MITKIFLTSLTTFFVFFILAITTIHYEDGRFKMEVSQEWKNIIGFGLLISFVGVVITTIIAIWNI